MGSIKHLLSLPLPMCPSTELNNLLALSFHCNGKPPAGDKHPSSSRELTSSRSLQRKQTFLATLDPPHFRTSGEQRQPASSDDKRVAMRAHTCCGHPRAELPSAGVCNTSCKSGLRAIARPLSISSLQAPCEQEVEREF